MKLLATIIGTAVLIALLSLLGYYLVTNNIVTWNIDPQSWADKVIEWLETTIDKLTGTESVEVTT